MCRNLDGAGVSEGEQVTTSFPLQQRQERCPLVILLWLD